MATPFLSSFCCMNVSGQPDGSSPRVELDDTFHLSFNILCIASSMLGMYGAVDQLWLRLVRWGSRSGHGMEPILQQNVIIAALAFADLCAVVGVLLRSVWWLIVPIMHQAGTSRLTFQLVCAVSCGWIEYFNVCAYFWIFLHAVDMLCLSTENYRCILWLYHFISWAGAGFLCGVGAMMLYFPNIRRCSGNWDEFLLPYLSASVPLLITLIASPILYATAYHLVRKNLERRQGFGEKEIAIIASVRWQFFTLVLVFYFCWFPNVVYGILLLLPVAPSSGHIVILQLMALLNPSHAFVNRFAYAGIGLRPAARDHRSGTDHSRPDNSPVMEDVTDNSGHSELDRSSDTSRLLTFRNS